MAAEVRNELLRQLLRGGAAGVELLEAAEKERRFLADGARRGVAGETAVVVQVERVLERLDGAGEVAAQALPLLGRRRARGRVTGAGGVGAGGEGAVRAGVGPHEDLLHHGLLVGARAARPALQRGRHRWRTWLLNLNFRGQIGTRIGAGVGTKIFAGVILGSATPARRIGPNRRKKKDGFPFCWILDVLDCSTQKQSFSNGKQNK